MPDPKKETEEGLPILTKSPSAASTNNSATEEGLPILKKKVESEPSNVTSTSNSPSPTEGGSSGLDVGKSALPKIDFEAARTYMAPAKTALGNKVIAYTKPSATISLAEEASNKKLATDQETKMLVDNFEKHRATSAPDEKFSTADFYLENLKQTNPDEYNYTIDKQAALSEEADPLKIQEYHAELIKKSLALKKRVMGGKIDIVSNNINDNYKTILDDFDAKSKEAESIATKIKGIDDFISQNYQVAENGEIITNPTNKKVAEDMIKKRNAFLEELEANKTKLDEYSENQDLKDAITQLDDLQKTYDSAASLYKDFVDKNPDAYKGLPEVKKQIEKEQMAQFSKDLDEKVSGGDLGIMEGSGRGATAIVKSLAYGVKNLGEDKGYGFTDTFYDDVKGSLDKFDNESNPLPTGYNKPVYEDGKWNLQYLPGKLSQTVVEMAPMALATSGVGLTAGLIARGAATKELGYTLGSFIGEHVITASNYYDEAREAGMSENEAQDFANKTATFQAMISMLSPDLKLLKSNKLGLEDYTKMVAQGVSKKEAAKQTAKTIVNNMLKEVPQENLQTWKEIQDQNSMYEAMGLNEKVKESITNDVVETTVVSAILTAGFGMGGARSASTLQKEAAFMAASQPDLVLERGKKMLEKGIISPEQFDDLSVKMAKASEALQKIDKNLPSETKADVLPAMIEKNDLKAEKQLVDDSQHDIINEKIKNKDEEIKNIMEAPSKEQIEHDDFLKGFEMEISKDDTKPVVEIEKSENEMQLDGLIEKDDSQKSVPIELSVAPEKTEKDSNEEKIALLEQARKDLKEKEFWQEKIDYKEFSKRDNAIEKEINALRKPATIQSETEEIKKEPVAEKKPEAKTENNTQTPATIETEKGPTTESTKKKTPDVESLVDEEEEAEDQVKDDQVILKKMQDDLEVLKTFSPNNMKMDSKSDDEIKTLATKKYQGMIERAYKAKLDGKINKSTYTIFRNAAEDILGPKIAEKNREVKGQIDAIKEKIKERLLGEGYKNVLLSAPGINPKTVADFIDLTAELVKKGVDAGHEVRKVVDKALDYIKSHKNYADALKAEGVTDKKFRKMFESKIGEIESIVEEPEQEEKKSEEKKPVVEKTTTESNKETVDSTSKEEKPATEKTTESNKKPVISELPTDKNKQTKTGTRFSASEKYSKVLKTLAAKAFNYDTLKKADIEKYVNDNLDKFEGGMLVDLANDMINGNNPFPAKVQKVAEGLLIERLRAMAEEEGITEMDQKMLNTVSGKLAVKLSEAINVTATQLSLHEIITKSLPLSEKGVEAFVEEKLKDVQQSYLSPDQKQDITDIDKLVREMVDAEINRIAEELNGKEWSEDMDSKIDSLKIDLSEC
jgi:hypothetical protein